MGTLDLVVGTITVKPIKVARGYRRITATNRHGHVVYATVCDRWSYRQAMADTKIMLRFRSDW